MSTGHRHGARKTDAELYRMLGDGDTSALYAMRITLDTSHDIPYAGGASVDGRTIYIDRELYREIMDGKVAVRGMSPRQIVQAFVEHEHTEKAVDDGDNPVDAYLGAHGFGTAKEHAFVRMLQVDPKRYEAAISDALDRCAKRGPDNPPRDLWCGPYLDDPARPRDPAHLPRQERRRRLQGLEARRGIRRRRGEMRGLQILLRRHARSLRESLRARALEPPLRLVRGGVKSPCRQISSVLCRVGKIASLSAGGQGAWRDFAHADGGSSAPLPTLRRFAAQ